MKEYIITVDESKPDITGSVPLMEPPKELIRCKDCAFHDSGENEVDAWNRCKLHKINTSDDEFCSWGMIRREHY